MKKIISVLLILTMAFCFTACEEDITSEKYIAEKKAFYNDIITTGELKPADGSVILDMVEDGINVTVKISENYTSMGNEKATMDIIMDGNTVYLHIVAAAREADLELGTEASDAVDEWYVHTFTDGEESPVDSFFEGYEELADMSDVASAEFIETIKVDGKKLDKVKLTSTAEEGEEPETMTVYVDAKNKLIVSAEGETEETTVKMTFNEKKLEAPTVPSGVEPVDTDSLTFAFAILGFFMLLA